MGVLSDLSVALEDATDTYVEVCDRAAVAENDAERVELTAYVKFRDEGCAVSDAEKKARHAALDERAVSRIAAAAEKAARRKCASLESRLTAAMSHQKFVGAQDGGQR